MMCAILFIISQRLIKFPEKTFVLPFIYKGWTLLEDAKRSKGDNKYGKKKNQNEVTHDNTSVH